MKTDQTVEIAIIGAGVVGLGVARLLAMRGHEVTVFEEEDAVGTHTSARGSHVIHSGIYYTPGSLKAKLCVEGKQLLYDYCAEKNIGFRRLGKIIIATDERETGKLHALEERAKQNGVNDLEWMSAEKVARLEPHVKCANGLFSPSTGIIDGPGLLKALRAEAEEHKARVLVGSPVARGEATGDGVVLTIGPANKKVLCKAVINSAGFKAQAVARSIDGIRTEKIPGSYYAKGHYFRLKGPSPFHHLIYPLPVPGGLGIHVTMDLAGNVRFGPDVFWTDKIDYSFESNREHTFYTAIRTYYPELPDGGIEPGYTGIRSKIVPSGRPEQDFMIQGVTEHGVPGLINLFGIESPGFTSSIAISHEVERRLNIGSA